MIYTPKIKKAIKVSLQAHSEQTRKTRIRTPFIYHPLLVATLVSRVNQDENIITAAILHDVPENAPENLGFHLEFIEKQFGNKVFELVEKLTEDDKNAPWEERKNSALLKISKMSQEAMLIKSADQIVNVYDLNEEIERYGTEVDKRYKRPLPKMLENYENIFLELRVNWPENPFLEEFEKEIERFKKLIE